MKMKELLPPDLTLGDLGEVNLDVPSYAFLPDQWSFAFMRGLLALVGVWAGKRIWEIGVGTGVNQLILGRVAPKTTQFYFSDLNPRCTMLTAQNLRVAKLVNPERFTALPGAWDLVTPSVGSHDQVPTDVDVIFACIPQVPSKINPSVKDWMAHYYDPTRYPKAHWHALGLGLNETLLRRAHNVLAPNGQVILNLGGRPGFSRLTEMFCSCGYCCQVVHQETIPQLPSTSLATLAAFEDAGHPDFEFFADSSGNVRLNAREAEARRQGGTQVYHRIYVIKGTLLRKR